VFPVVTTRTGLGRDLLDRAAALAKRSGATMHAVLLAALRRALAEATGDPAPVVWITSANRDERFEQLAGHCVELVPVRAPLPPAADLDATIAGTRRAVVEALTGRPVPYGFLLRHLGRPAAGPWADGMSVLFDLQHRDATVAAPPGLDVEVVDVPPVEGMMDVAVTVVAGDGFADLEVAANPAVAGGWTADALRDRLAAALRDEDGAAPGLDFEVTGLAEASAGALRARLRERFRREGADTSLEADLGEAAAARGVTVRVIAATIEDGGPAFRELARHVDAELLVRPS
jgi:hypothetical protein